MQVNPQLGARTSSDPSVIVDKARPPIGGLAAATFAPGEASEPPSSSQQIQPQPPTEENLQSMENAAELGVGADAALRPRAHLPSPLAGNKHSCA